jgi:pSer/pThr/pTyr-binding forkhead associated (FHA) protein
MVQSDVPGFTTPAGGEATRVMGAPPVAGMGYEATQQAMTVTCAVCGTPNGPAERYCQDCGFMFGSAPGEVEPLPDLSQLPRLLETATGRELMLNPGANSVGRENADVLLMDPTVSRRHAQVTLENGQVTVEDFGSTNGTQVSGRRLAAGERASAFDGDTVKFGSVALTLAVPGGAARPADAAAPAAVAEPAPVEDRGEPVAFLSLGDGTEYPLYAGVNSLGRRSSNHIVLADAFASGKHAEITVNEDGTAQLVDVGSTNGSFIAGERLAANAPVALTEGLSVTLGKTALTYRSAAPAPMEDSAPEPASEPAPEVIPDPEAPAAAPPAEEQQ